MKITIQTPDFKATKKLTKFVKKSILKVCKHRNNILEGHVILTPDKSSTQDDKICEVRLVIAGNDLFARRQSETFEEAVTQCLHAIRHQISRWEDSVDRGRRRGSKPATEAITPQPQTNE